MRTKDVHVNYTLRMHCSVLLLVYWAYSIVQKVGIKSILQWYLDFNSGWTDSKGGFPGMHMLSSSACGLIFFCHSISISLIHLHYHDYHALKWFLYHHRLCPNRCHSFWNLLLFQHSSIFICIYICIQCCVGQFRWYYSTKV